MLRLRFDVIILAIRACSSLPEARVSYAPNSGMNYLH